MFLESLPTKQEYLLFRMMHSRDLLSWMILSLLRSMYIHVPRCMNIHLLVCVKVSEGAEKCLANVLHFDIYFLGSLGLN